MLGTENAHAQCLWSRAFKESVGPSGLFWANKSRAPLNCSRWSWNSGCNCCLVLNQHVFFFNTMELSLLPKVRRLD